MRAAFLINALASVMFGLSGASVSAEAKLSSNENEFGIRTMQLITSVVRGLPDSETIVGTVHQMDMKSGRSVAVPLATFVDRISSYSFDKISFSDTDNNLMMKSSATRNGCWDGLHVRFYPKGDKVDVQFTTVERYICPITVPVVPQPTNGM